MNVNAKPLSLSDKPVTWEQLYALDAVVEELGKDDRTVEMYAKDTGLSLSRASAVLREHWRAGRLTRRKGRGHTWIYCPAKG